MLAAQKLYPQSLVVFPGSQDKTLRNFFIKSMVYLLNITSIKNIDFSKVTLLVLVDTRRPKRIGNFSTILTKPDLKIHIYDHHPDRKNDIKGDLEVIASTGATATIISEILQEKKIDISPDEATIICLGIYEDTGSFTFPSTTKRDFLSAAFLLSKGANLKTISNLIIREISPEEVVLLNDMIQSASYHHINGVDIVITQVISDDYLPDMAILAHKMLNMANLNALFVLALMENKIYIVGRSKIPEVDISEIVMPFGGGGHASAASATVKNKTITQTENDLLSILHKEIKSPHNAVNLMSSPPIIVGEETSCKDAARLLTRYNIYALLITKRIANNKILTGFISRQTIEKAIYHKLGNLPVKEYMTKNIASVGSNATLDEVQEKIIENKQRVLPVMEKNNIIGVITRTDLLNTLVQKDRDFRADSFSHIDSKKRHGRARNIRNFLLERLSKRLFKILQDIGKTADELGCNAFVVGGFVRDLFLFRKNEDVDIVIEGDGINFAKGFAKKNQARIHYHVKFGTAVIIFPDGFKIDVASARMEYYESPAALPVVEMSSIKLDLFRRDFTINTLAIYLNSSKFGTLIDFFLARKDIKVKAIRVLHNLSFVEDPTRVFRAIRFEQRFGFTIGKLTKGLIENAAKMNFFQRLSGKRVFTELRQILDEETPLASIKRLNDFNLLKVIHPSIELNNDLIETFDAVKKVLSWHDLLFLEESYMKWAVYFLALIRKRQIEEIEDICQKLELPEKLSMIFSKEFFEIKQNLKNMKEKMLLDNSIIYNKLKGFRTELVLYVMAQAKQRELKRAISQYLTSLRYIKTSIGGKDLIKMDVEPGPVYSKILGTVLNAKLKGQVKTRAQELALAKRLCIREKNALCAN